jgi:oligopeptide transport system substrate-binding protein
MSEMTRRNFLKAFGVSSATLMAAACGGNGGGATTGAAATGAADATKQSIAVCLASEPDNIDPCMNSAVDGATMIVHLFSGLAKWESKDGKYEIVADCAKELPEGEVQSDGKVVYTYELKDGLKWSDGKDLKAGDFAFSWQRASNIATGGDYAYMYENVDGYSADDPNAKLNVEAVDDKHLKVTLKNVTSYWNELLAFPVFFPVREDVVSNEAWATDPSTYISNGAYMMTGWDHNSVITVEKNPNYHDADAITMGKVEFFLSDDANNQLSNFENGTWQLIDDVPTNEIASLKEKYPDEFKIDGQIGTYYVSWNVNEEILPNPSEFSTPEEAEVMRMTVRNAINHLFDRNYIVEQIAQGGQVPAASYVAMGMKNPDGSDFTSTANDGKGGYYSVKPEDQQSNYEGTVEILKGFYAWDESSKKFTNMPTLTYLYNTSEAHKAIGEYLQSAVAQVGLTLNLENQEWNTFLNTRKSGDFSIARNGWVADYTDPICFLDMWTTASGNNDVQFGRGKHGELKMYRLDLSDLGDKYKDVKVENGTWADTYDRLISAIKSETDQEIRYKMMHRAEDLLMATGCICPLYFYTDLYMISKKVKGFFSIPLGYKFFHYSTLEA